MACAHGVAQQYVRSTSPSGNALPKTTAKVMPGPFCLRAEIETSPALCDARGLYQHPYDNRRPKNRAEKRHSIASENHIGILSIQNEKMKQKDVTTYIICAKSQNLF